MNRFISGRAHHIPVINTTSEVLLSMFSNKSATGASNICGSRIRALRLEHGLSQNELATHLQVMGLHIDKNAIQRIESGRRAVIDVELLYFASYFRVTTDELLGGTS